MIDDHSHVIYADKESASMELRSPCGCVEEDLRQFAWLGEHPLFSAIAALTIAPQRPVSSVRSGAGMPWWG
jgi:hypothetical protein